jgi:hypothetical protein
MVSNAGVRDSWITCFSLSTPALHSRRVTPRFSPWAKILMMIQALISFATVALLAARAVNIL